MKKQTKMRVFRLGLVLLLGQTLIPGARATETEGLDPEIVSALRTAGIDPEVLAEEANTIYVLSDYASGIADHAETVEAVREAGFEVTP